MEASKVYEEQPVKGLLFFVQSRPIIKGCKKGGFHKELDYPVIQLLHVNRA